MATPRTRLQSASGTVDGSRRRLRSRSNEHACEMSNFFRFCASCPGLDIGNDRIPPSRDRLLSSVAMSIAGLATISCNPDA
jgi:hypothetical protein